MKKLKKDKKEKELIQKLFVGKYDEAFCLVQMLDEDKCKVISTSSWLKNHDGFISKKNVD